MRVGEVIDAYVALKTSLGMSFESPRRVLEQFSREIGNPPMGEVQAEAVAVFLRGRGALSATWALKYRILSGFYRFAISRGHAQSSPLPANVPKLPPPRSPYVYSVDELRRLLDATSVLHINNTPLQAPMCRMLLILLYGSGLRIGEALHLTLRDIDLIEKIVTVRHTKFFKTRLVPIGPKLAHNLAAYIQRRRELPLPLGEDSRLFTTKTGRGWPYPHVNTLFHHVRRAAVSFAPPNVVRQASTTFDTRLRSIELSRGIVLAAMFSGCCHASRLTSATSTSNPPSVIST